jgi:hypothetical protein
LALKGKKYQDRRVIGAMEGAKWPKEGLGQIVTAIKKGWVPPAADPPSHD